MDYNHIRNLESILIKAYKLVEEKADSFDSKDIKQLLEKQNFTNLKGLITVELMKLREERRLANNIYINNNNNNDKNGPIIIY